MAPDIYADAQGSLDRGSKYFDLIRSLGFPVAVVAQDGGENLDYPWDDFDCLFIGGAYNPNPKKEWKTSEAAARLCLRARNHGKWVHMGRVNSPERLLRAREMGCLSADGTYLKYRRRKNGHGDAGSRGAQEFGVWMEMLDNNPPDKVFELPNLPIHREAIR